MNDYVIVKVRLRAPEGPNESNIKTEWAEILQAWAAQNGCVVDHIEWQRIRYRFVSNPALAFDEVYWDRVEEAK